MCNVTPGLGRVETHHGYPKAIFPELAYQLSNGVTLCLRCHRGVVHAENTFDDGGNWKRFLPMWRRLRLLVDNREFNTREQHRIAQ